MSNDENRFLQLEYMPLRIAPKSIYDFVGIIACIKGEKHVYIFEGEPKEDEVIDLVSNIMKKYDLSSIIYLPKKLSYLKHHFKIENSSSIKKTNSYGINYGTYLPFCAMMYKNRINEHVFRKNKRIILNRYKRKFGLHGYIIEQIPRIPEAKTISFEIKYFGRPSYVPEEDVIIKLEMLETHTLEDLAETITYQAFRWEDPHAGTFYFDRFFLEEDEDVELDVRKWYYCGFDKEDLEEYAFDSAFDEYVEKLDFAPIEYLESLELDLKLIDESEKRTKKDRTEERIRIQKKIEETKKRGITIEELIEQFKKIV
ncbi:MAG: hypothetical protein QXX77_08825, partial [Candidatus Methanosuratincola sp.]